MPWVSALIVLLYDPNRRSGNQGRPPQASHEVHMRLSAHIHWPLKALALASAFLVSLPGHAALTPLKLASGLEVSQDAATGLLWRSFDDVSVGVQSGFRQATVADFNTLLNNQGYLSTGRVPDGLTERVVIPAVTQTIDMGWGFATRDGSPLSQDAIDAADSFYRRYQADLETLARGEFPPENEVTAELVERWYVDGVKRYATRYGLGMVNRTNTVTITPEQIFDRPVAAGVDGLQASYYSSGALSGFQVAGIHEYDNSYSFASEYHHAFIGKLATSEGYWLGVSTSNHIPFQCQPGDAGYNPYGNQVQYCGGRSYTTAYLGPEASTEFKNSFFSRTDYSPGVKPYGHLMVQEVPEPAAHALMGLGLVGLAWVRSRQRRPV
jgi:PEP-CTERM motif